MTEHTDILKEARELTNRLNCDETQRLPGLPFKSMAWLPRVSPTLCTLAKIVEREDKVKARQRTQLERCGLMMRTQRAVIEQQDKVRAKLIDACQSADVAITDVFDSTQYPESGYWINLRTARYKTNRAITSAGDIPTTELEDQREVQQATRKYRDDMRRLAKQSTSSTDSVNAELVAACVAGGKAITTVLNSYKPIFFGQLQAAGLQLRRAVKPADDQLIRVEAGMDAEDKRQIDAEVETAESEESRPKVNETIARATRDYDPLLRRLGDTTNLPAEPPAPQPDWDRWHELLDIRTQRALTTSEKQEEDEYARIAARLDAEEGKAADVALDNLAKGHERITASIRRLTDAVLADAKQPAKPPAIEVERKLEAYPKLLWIAVEVVRMHSVTSADWPGSDWRNMVGDLAGVAKVAIAKAKELNSSEPPPIEVKMRENLRDLWRWLNGRYGCHIERDLWEWLKPCLDTLKQVSENHPVPPIEVEMRLRPNRDVWVWEFAINDPTSPPAKMWVRPSVLNECGPIESCDIARARGEAWLAALGKQLGVPLVAAWKDSV